MSDPARDPSLEELTVTMTDRARAIAWRHWHGAPAVLDFEELLSLAYQGLAQALARWPSYCEANHYDPELTRYFGAYASRRMNGAILDYKRGEDWVSRTVRANARALREAGQDLGATEAEMAHATGLSRAEVAETIAAMARRPARFDPAEHDMADLRAGTEDIAATAGLLDAAVSGLERLPLPARVMSALTFYAGMNVRDAASAAGLEERVATAAHREAALAAHQALLGAARRERDAD